MPRRGAGVRAVASPASAARLSSAVSLPHTACPMHRRYKCQSSCSPCRNICLRTPSGTNTRGGVTAAAGSSSKGGSSGATAGLSSLLSSGPLGALLLGGVPLAGLRGGVAPPIATQQPGSSSREGGGGSKGGTGSGGVGTSGGSGGGSSPGSAGGSGGRRLAAAGSSAISTQRPLGAAALYAPAAAADADAEPLAPEHEGARPPPRAAATLPRLGFRRTCPDGRPRVNCFANPCDVGSPCPPGAGCVPNYCGGCNVVCVPASGQPTGSSTSSGGGGDGSSSGGSSSRSGSGRGGSGAENGLTRPAPPGGSPKPGAGPGAKPPAALPAPTGGSQPRVSPRPATPPGSKQPGGAPGCPPGVLPVLCVRDPCIAATCPAGTECAATHCGSCRAECRPGAPPAGAPQLLGGPAM